MASFTGSLFKRMTLRQRARLCKKSDKMASLLVFIQQYVWHLRFQTMFSLAFILNQSNIKLFDCSPGYYLTSNQLSRMLAELSHVTFDSGILPIMDKSCSLIICTLVMKWGDNNSLPVKRIPSKSPSLVNFEVKLSRNWDSWNKRTKKWCHQKWSGEEKSLERNVEQIN